MVAWWVAEGRGAVAGSLRGWAGDLRPDALSACAAPWAALAAALADAGRLDVGRVLILTNWRAGLAQLDGLKAPAATEHVRLWRVADVEERARGKRGEWLAVPCGGDAEYQAQWDVIRALGGEWPGRWAAQYVENLPKARGLWEQSQ